MIVGTCKVYMFAEWVYSLKEKRTIVKSITDKVKAKFNVSIAEIENQDIHKNIVIGFTCVTNKTEHANSIIQNVINYIENTADAVVSDVVIEIF